MNRIVVLVFMSTALGASEKIKEMNRRQAGTCADAINNCVNYGKGVCSDPTYTDWVLKNCQAYCHKCPGTSNGNHGAFTGSSTGCVYKDHVYQQGETWKDGCTYSCTCHDAATGKYTCTGLCLKWNLPPSCSLNPPGPGKCCQTPNCPPNIQVQYPPGYVEQ
ncbi:CCN family member 3 [Magallana gigas]|uniref:CCN family member 3 n=1 Tax=Magallana gigas TaxID=29159 RepID=UPI00333EA760